MSSTKTSGGSLLLAWWICTTWILSCPFLDIVAAFQLSPRHKGASSVESQLYHAKDHNNILVSGLEYRPVTIDINDIGPVTILEATAQAQDSLVDMALEEEEGGGGGEEDSVVVKNQLKSGDPYGAVLWPAASSIANRLVNILMKEEQNSENLTILELGTGTGLVSLAASMTGIPCKIVATDYEQVPLELLQHAQTLNSCRTSIETSLLDICDLAVPLPSADVVVAADIMYEPVTGRAMAQRVVEALLSNSRVLIGDSPGRPGRPAFITALQETLSLEEGTNLFEPSWGTTCEGPRHDLICGPGSTSISITPKQLEVAIMDLTPQQFGL